MHKVYLAGRYGRREELAGYAAQLEDYGIETTSRWLSGDHDDPAAGETREQFRMRCAEIDLFDVDEADTLIAFTEDRSMGVKGAGRGGRHVELGYAIALHKGIHLVGPRENVFCWLPGVQHWDTWHKFMKDYVSEHYNLAV